MEKFIYLPLILFCFCNLDLNIYLLINSIFHKLITNTSQINLFMRQ